MHFYVRTFTLLQLESQLVLYSACSSSFIKDERIKGLLRWLLPFSGKIVASGGLIEKLEALSLEKESTLAYLTGYLKLLAPCGEASLDRLDAVFITSTDTRAKSLLLAELPGLVDVPTVELEGNSVASYKNPLIVAFFENFREEQIRALYRQFQTTPVSFITSYVIHRNIVIDGLFVPFKGTPCHFCFSERWKSAEKAKRQVSEASWYNYIERAANAPESLTLSLPVDQSDIGLLVATLKKKIYWLTRDDELPTWYDPRAFTRYHLDEGSWDHDLIPHWPSCRCITESWA